VTAGWFAPLCAVAGVVFVLAEFVYPAWPGYHVWEYATALVLLAIPAAGRALELRRESAGSGLGLFVALLGSLVIMATGIGSGLLGPDTEIVQKPPGTVAPLPDVGAAAFFPNANADDIARGNEGVILRRLGASPVDIEPGSRRLVGATELELVPRLAAYVEARDTRGERLTITQPTSPAFLSPVLLFPERVTVAGKNLPADAFATPAVRRQIKAFYFSKADSEAARAHGMAGAESVLFAVDDDSGKPVRDGIGFAASHVAVDLGGVRLQPTIGTYPALAISAVPYPPTLGLGGLLVIGGLALFATRSVRNHSGQKA
jgi:hypothetical protein